MKIALAIILSLYCLAAGAAEAVTLRGEMPAAGLERLEIDAHVGEARITTGDDDVVRWEIVLEPSDGFSWFTNTKHRMEKIGQIELKSTRRDDKVELELDYPSGLDYDDVEENWRIQVPARFAVDADMNVGALTLEGMSGGVKAALNVGELTIETPAGALDAQVNVGDLRAASASDSVGNIHMEANVGDANLKLKGERVDATRGFGPGASISVQREGRDNMNLEVNVGEVGLEIK